MDKTFDFSLKTTYENETRAVWGGATPRQCFAWGYQYLNHHKIATPIFF